MRVRHYMVRTANAASVELNSSTLGQVLARMTKHHMQQLLLVNSDGEFAGEITTFILAKMLLPDSGDANQSHEEAEDETVVDVDDRIMPHLGRRVSDFAEHDIPIMHPETPLMEAVRLLAGGRLRLPVVDPETNKMVGVISCLTVLRRYQF